MTSKFRGQGQQAKEDPVERVYRWIFDKDGHLKNDPHLQIVLATLNIEIEHLHEKKLQDFLIDEYQPVTPEIAQVRFKYWVQRRKAKLLQIERALKPKKGDNSLITKGINSKALEGIGTLSKDLQGAEKLEEFVIPNIHVSKLINKLAHKKEYISPALQMIGKNSVRNNHITDYGGAYASSYGASFAKAGPPSQKSDHNKDSLPALREGSRSQNRSTRVGGVSSTFYHQRHSSQPPTLNESNYMFKSPEPRHVGSTKKPKATFVSQSQALGSIPKHTASANLPSGANSISPSAKHLLTTNSIDTYQSIQPNQEQAMEAQRQRMMKMFSTQESLLQLHQRRQEKREKELQDKEKKIKKCADSVKRQLKEKMKKFQAKNLNWQHRIETYAREKEFEAEEAHQRYHSHLTDVRLRVEEKKKLEKDQAEVCFLRYNEQRMADTSSGRKQKQPMNLIGASSRQDSPLKKEKQNRVRSQRGHFVDSDDEISHRMQIYEDKLQRSKDRSKRILAEKSQAMKTKVAKISSKLLSRHEVKEKTELDTWATFITQQSKREKKITTFSKRKENDFQRKVTQKNFDWASKQEHISRHREFDGHDLIEQVGEKSRQKMETIEAQKSARKTEIKLRSEKEQLKQKDAKRSLERQKQERQQENLRILSKHQKIGKKLELIKKGKKHMVEYTRLANEIRLMSKSAMGDQAFGQFLKS